MASSQALEVAEAVYEMILANEGGPMALSMTRAREFLADSIDDLLKNLLVARIDQYTVK